MLFFDFFFKAKKIILIVCRILTLFWHIYLSNIFFFVYLSRSFEQKMSWHPYVDIMLKDPCLKAACLVGHDGGIWSDGGTPPAGQSVNTAACVFSAASMDAAAIKKEVAALMDGVKDKTKFQMSGIVVGTIKYMFVNVIEDKNVGMIFVGKKGNSGIMLCTTNKALVLGILKDGSPASNVTQVAFIGADIKSKTF